MTKHIVFSDSDENEQKETVQEHPTKNKKSKKKKKKDKIKEKDGKDVDTISNNCSSPNTNSSSKSSGSKSSGSVSKSSSPSPLSPPISDSSNSDSHEKFQKSSANSTDGHYADNEQTLLEANSEENIHKNMKKESHKTKEDKKDSKNKQKLLRKQAEVLRDLPALDLMSGSKSRSEAKSRSDRSDKNRSVSFSKSVGGRSRDNSGSLGEGNGKKKSDDLRIKVGMKRKLESDNAADDELTDGSIQNPASVELDENCYFLGWPEKIFLDGQKIFFQTEPHNFSRQPHPHTTDDAKPKKRKKSKISKKSTQNPATSDSDANVPSQWSNVELGSQARKNKFLSLMGANKKKNLNKSSLAGRNVCMNDRQTSAFNDKLQDQFERARSSHFRRGFQN